MAKKYIIGNWKSHKSLPEAREWLTQVLESPEVTSDEEKVAVVCPPFTLLTDMKKQIEFVNSPLRLGAQNCSPFEAGAYTGEVTAEEVKELASYVIVGHSERREHFGETDEMLSTKVTRAKAAGLTVIFCVQGKGTSVPSGVDIIAYEPISAIGSGKPDSPEDAEAVCAFLKEKTGVSIFLYGGSVKPDNISSFTAQTSIDGALVGGASLEASVFISLLHNA